MTYKQEPTAHRQTERQTDRQTDRQANAYINFCHCPFLSDFPGFSSSLSPLPCDLSSCPFFHSSCSTTLHLSSLPLFLFYSLISISLSVLLEVRCQHRANMHSRTERCAISSAPLAASVTGRLVKRIKSHSSVLSHFHQSHCVHTCVYKALYLEQRVFARMCPCNNCITM